MNLTSRVGCALTLAALCGTALSGCTGDPEPTQPTATKPVVLTLAAAETPTDQALAEVYAQALKAAGYTVEVRSSKDPYQLLIDDQIDIAIDVPASAVTHFATVNDPRGEDQVLSVDEVSALVAELNAGQEKIRALEPTPANAGDVLVMSAAEAITHQVESMPTLAAACPDLTFVTASEPGDGLMHTLAAEGCPVPEIDQVDPEQLHDQLRQSLNRVVVLGADDAVISDEGFSVVPDSAALFDAQPYLALLGAAVDEPAQQALEQTTAQVTQEALTSLNRLVSGPHALKPADAAQRWPWIIDN